jgi:hypothetical protein
MAISLTQRAISSTGTVSAAAIDPKRISLNTAGALLGYRVKSGFEPRGVMALSRAG